MGPQRTLTLIVGLFTLMVCNQTFAKSGTAPEQNVEQTDRSATLNATSRIAPAPKGTSPYMNLVDLVHLADVYDPAGLFINFGTEGRHKYTNGNWNSGWQDDITESGVSVSTFGKQASVLFPIMEPAPLVARMRIKAYTSGPLITYLNGKTLRETKVSTENGFTEVVVSLPVNAMRVGENKLMLRTLKTKRVDGKQRSLAMDWIRIEPPPAQAESEAAAAINEPINVTVHEATAHGVSRQSIELAPDTQIDWFVELPANSTLVFGTATGEASTNLNVHVDTDSKQTSSQFAVRPSWSDHTVNLSQFAGQIARVRFRNDGASKAFLSDARIVRKAAHPQKQNKDAKNIIVLLIDTLRASKLQQYYPKSRVQTPALDKFASEGVMFERAQAPENWTKPSVASVLTSLHPATHKTKQESSKLPSSALMLSEVLQDSGFKTASFIANGYVSNAFGFDQGWDHYTNYIREQRSTNATNVFGEAEEWIEKNKDQRFFVYIQTIDPHVPYDPPRLIFEKVRSRTIFGTGQESPHASNARRRKKESRQI